MALAVQQTISNALEIGVPLFNNGNPQACYEVYAQVAQGICGSISNADVRNVLQRAIQDASQQRDASQRAWTMRRALDVVAAEPNPLPPSTGGPIGNPSDTRIRNTLLIDFSDTNAAKAWFSVDDRVMGGSSLSRMRQAGSVSVFEGNLVVEAGGVAQQCCRLALAEEDTCLVLEAKGDGRRGYRLSIASAAGDSRVRYQMPLDLNGSEFTRLRLPLRDFKPVLYGSPVANAPPLRPRDVREIGLMLRSSEPGGFELQVRRLEAANSV